MLAGFRKFLADVLWDVAVNVLVELLLDWLHALPQLMP